MASHTLKQRIDDLITLAGTYDLTFPISRSLLAQAIEWGRDDTFYEVFPTRPNFFKSTAFAFTDQDPVPEDWLGIIRWNTTVTAVVYPGRYIQIKKIPAAKVRQNIKGVATDPVMWLCGGKFETVPAGTTGNIFYYQFPRQLYYDDRNDIDETVTDSMPTDVEPLIVRAAFELLLFMLVTQKELYQLTQIQVDAVEKARLSFYESMTKELNTDFTKG